MTSAGSAGSFVGCAGVPALLTPLSGGAGASEFDSDGEFLFAICGAEWSCVCARQRGSRSNITAKTTNGNRAAHPHRLLRTAVTVRDSVLRVELFIDTFPFRFELIRSDRA